MYKTGHIICLTTRAMLIASAFIHYVENGEIDNQIWYA